MMRPGLLVAALLGVPAPALAIDADQFHYICASTSPNDKTACIMAMQMFDHGYLTGTEVGSTKRTHYCFRRGGGTWEDVRDRWVIWGYTNYKELKGLAGVAFFSFLMKTYPCN